MVFFKARRSNVMGFISIWILLTFYQGAMGQLRACRNRSADVNDIAFSVSADVRVDVTGPKSLQLYVDVTWTMDNPADLQLDGLAVHMSDKESKRDHTATIFHSIEPTTACHSGENHMWVSTTSTNFCDTNGTIPECARDTLTGANTNACLCPQPECGLFYPAPCLSTTHLLGPEMDYFLTVLPTTRSLSYPVNFDTEYEFSISPYYREFSNLSPLNTPIAEISTCHPAVLEVVGSSAIGSSCMEITWTAVPDVNEYVVEVSIGPANVTNIITGLTTTNTSAKICGLNLCVSYTVTISYFVGELKEILQAPSTHIIPLVLPTPDTTTAGTGTDTTNSQVNPCSQAVCDDNAFCEEVDNGGYNCICNTGYTGDGKTCADIFECKLDLDSCSPNAACFNFAGSYDCQCNAGYNGNGFVCNDVDECETQNPCTKEHQLCVNTPGFYKCDCKQGFLWNGTNCYDPLCTKLEGNQAGACVEECSIAANCSGGQYCCHNGCGRTCIPFQDPRCPVIQEIGAICIGECMNDTNCRRNEICCYNGCGRLCVPVEVEVKDSCVRQEIEDFTFPSSFPGLVSYSEEKCPDTTRPLASISCISTSSNTSRFDLSTLVRTDCTETVRGVTSKPFDTPEQVAETLEQLQVLTSDIGGIVQDDVKDITKYFEDISSTNFLFPQAAIGNVAEITSHISEYFGQNEQEESSETTRQKQSLVQSLTTLSRKLNEDAATEFTAISNDINIKVQDVANVDTITSTLTFTPNFYSGSSRGMFISPMEIKIPGEAFVKASEALDQAASSSPRSKRATSAVRIVAVGYRNSSLFPSNRDTNWVIASSLGDTESSLENIELTDPVVITNNEIDDTPQKVQRDEFKTDLTNLECVFWDFKNQWWSRDGCCLVLNDPPECHCNHLTNFALLVSKEEIGTNIALTIVTYIGCGLSAICLICTILVVSFSKRLRRKQPMQVIMNICGCLAVSFLLFMFGVDAGSHEVGCSILAAFLHYALLASWFWMAIYSHTVYRDVIKVMETRGQRYNMLTASLVSYGIPAVIVLLNAGITLGHIDKVQPTYSCNGADPFIDSSYNARNFCWLQNNSLYFGFLLPVGILLVYNIVVYCVVIPKITCCKKQVGSSASPKSAKQNATISVVMATTVGLSWIIGYFMLLSDDQVYLQVMSWLFAITNAFQGVFIFILTIVRTGEIQKLFKSKKFGSFSTERNKTNSTATSGLSPLPSPLPKA